LLYVQTAGGRRSSNLALREFSFGSFQSLMVVQVNFLVLDFFLSRTWFLVISR